MNSKNKVAESIREHDENSIYFFGARSANFFSTEPLYMSSPFEMILKLLIFKPKSENFPIVDFFEYQSSKSLNGVKYFFYTIRIATKKNCHHHSVEIHLKD